MDTRKFFGYRPGYQPVYRVHPGLVTVLHVIACIIMLCFTPALSREMGRDFGIKYAVVMVAFFIYNRWVMSDGFNAVPRWLLWGSIAAASVYFLWSIGHDPRPMLPSQPFLPR
jgi:hypothetical protein